MIRLLKSKIRDTDTPLPEKGIFTFLNPHSYLEFRKNPELYAPFDGIFLDGVALSILAKLAGIKARRTSFDMTSIAPQVIRTTAQRSQTAYLIGSTGEAITEFSKQLINLVADLKIIKARDGYFTSTEEREQIIDEILDLNPDLILVGMGVPIQEKFLSDLKTRGWMGLGYTCGGFFHQTAKKGLQYYPSIINKLHLRWLYRIYDEPKLISRYLLRYPQFLYYFMSDLLAYKITSKSTKP